MVGRTIGGLRVVIVADQRTKANVCICAHMYAWTCAWMYYCVHACAFGFACLANDPCRSMAQDGGNVAELALQFIANFQDGQIPSFGIWPLKLC